MLFAEFELMSNDTVDDMGTWLYVELFAIPLVATAILGVARKLPPGRIIVLAVVSAALAAPWFLFAWFFLLINTGADLDMSALGDPPAPLA